MDKRDQLLHKARKSKASTDWTAFKRARNKCNGKIREAKRKHYCNLMEENKGNPRKFWDTIKTIFPTNKKSSLPRMEKSKCKKNVKNFLGIFF